MKLRLSLVIATVFLISTITGCDLLKLKKETRSSASTYSAPVTGTVIATVNNMPITLEDLNADIEAYNSVVPEDKPENKIATAEQKVNYLKNEMVRRMLLYQEGLARGLDREDLVRQDLEKAKQQLVLMELGKALTENTDVTSKEIEDYYNSYKDQLKEPEQRQVREIVLGTEQEAKDMMIQLLQGADFATLAKDRSKAASAKNAGDLGFIQRGVKSAEFDEAAFSNTLEVGKISSIFKGPDGYYIIKLEAKRGGGQKSLSELWDNIKRMLVFLKQQQKIEDLVSKLSGEAKIVIDEGKVQ